MLNSCQGSVWCRAKMCKGHCPVLRPFSYHMVQDSQGEPSILVLVCLIKLFKTRFNKSVNRRNRIGNGTTPSKTSLKHFKIYAQSTMIQHLNANLWSSGRDCDWKSSCIKISECDRCPQVRISPACPTRLHQINVRGLILMASHTGWQLSWCISPSKRTRPRQWKQSVFSKIYRNMQNLTILYNGACRSISEDVYVLYRFVTSFA